YGAVHSALFRRRCAAPFWSKWLGDAKKSGGGVFDLLIHDVDFCIQLFGVPDAVSATGHEDLPKGIDTITATLHYREVPSVTITGGWHHRKAYPFSMEYTVVAEEGTFDFSSVSGDTILYDAQGESQTVKVPEEDAFEAELRYFLECCTHHRAPDFCPPEQSAAAVGITRLMAEARNKKGEKLKCPS
ncbi:MAG: Gfo/Idh/MocA family protein, partial [Bryobacteraceae bacterium]